MLLDRTQDRGLCSERFSCEFFMMEGFHLCPGSCVLVCCADEYYPAVIISMSWSKRRVHAPVLIQYVGARRDRVAVADLFPIRATNVATRSFFFSLSNQDVLGLCFKWWLFSWVVDILESDQTILDLTEDEVRQGKLVTCEQSEDCRHCTIHLCLDLLLP